jgi:hypothetical protein
MQGGCCSLTVPLLGSPTSAVAGTKALQAGAQV